MMRADWFTVQTTDKLKDFENVTEYDASYPSRT